MENMTLEERLLAEGYVAKSIQEELKEIEDQMEAEAIQAEKDLEAERIKYGY